MRYYNYIYIFTLLFIVAMIYDVLIGNVEGFEHKGGSFIPDKSIDTGISKQSDMQDMAIETVSITYNVSEMLARVLIMIPYNFLNNFIKMLTDSFDYMLDVIKPMVDLAKKLLGIGWENAKKIYLQCVDIFKQYTSMIRRMPELVKKYSEIGVGFIQAGIEKFQSFFENFFSMMQGVMDTLLNIPSTAFGAIEKTTQIGFKLFEKMMAIPESGLNSVLGALG